MATDKRNDPFRACNFAIEIDGIARGAFSEVGGLTADGDAVDYREGTDLQHNVRKLVGLRKYTNLTLKRGYTPDDSLWKWYGNIMNGQPDRRNVTIVLMNEAREPVMRWHAENAWINKIEGPAFKASGNEVAMESVELVHEGLTIEL
ncbi:MAG: phage tail protein [Gammaproteobacteria bacterium]|jgi:phage tail-like protein|nr:phage tail protein [Gammaproteobacteria bacterium]MDH4311674.1 phage tail protein [Gammaproteobacteria bacterium]MDH5274672.1 phage tail protein [Gammaproteobacteria bacterium]